MSSRNPSLAAGPPLGARFTLCRPTRVGARFIAPDPRRGAIHGARIAAAAIWALAACALTLAGCTRHSPKRTAEAGKTVAESEPSRATDERPVDPSASASYAGIAERNIFRPLVVAPKGPQGAPAPPSTKANEGGAGKPGSPPSGNPKGGGGPPRPPDPVADLALTGVIEIGGQLQALIERISTRLGRYLAIGEEIDGFRLKNIQPTSVVLEKRGKEYTLRMGDKELPAGPSASAPSAPPPGGPPGPGPPRAGPRSRRQFGGEMDMMRWADRMSLDQVERMYGTYKDRMTPEQRARAEEYLQRRRAQGR